MSLEQEIMERMSKDIAKEIDDGIISFMLVEIGWTTVQFHYKSNEHANDVTFWLLENCDNKKWKRFGSAYFFEDAKDAEWFILRWV
jgi:predicted nucleotidyltransferase